VLGRWSSLGISLSVNSDLADFPNDPVWKLVDVSDESLSLSSLGGPTRVSFGTGSGATSSESDSVSVADGRSSGFFENFFLKPDMSFDGVENKLFADRLLVRALVGELGGVVSFSAIAKFVIIYFQKSLGLN
jgi:hypothetical protein